MADAKQCALQRTWPQRTALSSVCECAVLRFTEKITADEDGLRKQTHTHTQIMQGGCGSAADGDACRS